jgi:dTMP kinase
MRFIVVDGLDGSGKDTQSKLLYDKFSKEGSCILRSHPSMDTVYGRKSKQALLGTGEFNKLKATVFYGMDVVHSLRKYYGEADTVIFTRYTLAVSYLPGVLGYVIYRVVCVILPTSEYMFFLDVSPNESLKRMDSRGEDTEMFENYDSLCNTREKINNVIYNWNVIPADNSIDEVYDEITGKISYLDSKLLK